MEFADLFLHPALMRAIERQGFEHPTPVQAQVIPAALEGQDLLVSAATGSGKTAAFLLPILQRLIDEPAQASGTRCLILVPTRELAQQVYGQFIALASFTRLEAGVITGGAPKSHQIHTLRQDPHVLIATPGRLLELIDLDEVDLSGVTALVLDEADRMLDMGFSPDVLRIVSHTPAGRHAMLFSATLQHQGLGPITRAMLNQPRVVTVDSFREQHPDIRQQIIPADHYDHKQQQLVWLLTHEPFAKALVFANSRERADALGEALRVQGVRAATLHGDLDQRERNRVMGLFRSGQVAVLVGTDLAARGLDVPGIDLVINYEMARNGSDYVHRIGRTGRAGEAGLAISLIAANEWARMSSIERFLNLEFERRTIAELKGKYRGPKRLKSSGKPVGKKPAAEPKKPEPPKVKVRERDRKNIGKRRAPSTPQPPGDAGPAEAGLAPPRRKR